MNAGYIKSLDGVRAVAILLVMTFHADIIGFGWIGVQLFCTLRIFDHRYFMERKVYGGISLIKIQKILDQKIAADFPFILCLLVYLGLYVFVIEVPILFSKLLALSF